MIRFGFTYKDYKAMLNKMERHDQEMDVAASLQETMLKTEIPAVDNVEIGAISVPAEKSAAITLILLNTAMVN